LISCTIGKKGKEGGRERKRKREREKRRRRKGGEGRKDVFLSTIGGRTFSLHTQCMCAFSPPKHTKEIEAPGSTFSLPRTAHHLLLILIIQTLAVL
jgi:hypothetical protein